MDRDRFEVALDVGQSDGNGSALDEVFEVLSNDHARYSMYYLSHQSTTTVAQLADFVTGAEAATAGTVAGPADRDRVWIRLFHVVLPKLDAIDYVDFDPGDRTVSRANVHPAVDSLVRIGG